MWLRGLIINIEFIFSSSGLRLFLFKIVLVFMLPGVHPSKPVSAFGHFSPARHEQGRDAFSTSLLPQLFPPFKTFESRGREMQPAGRAGLRYWGLC